jgi:hypothetical protein
VCCHTEYIDRIAQLVDSDATSIATVDSGADTNILGRGWLIVSEDPFRRINLVGFDAAHTQKRGLRLVTADTIVMTEDGQEDSPCPPICAQPIDMDNPSVSGPNTPCWSHC